MGLPEDVTVIAWGIGCESDLASGKWGKGTDLVSKRCMLRRMSREEN